VKTMDEVLVIALRGDVLKLGASRVARRAAAAAANAPKPDASVPESIQPGITH
jgi:hypothetical protein